MVLRKVELIGEEWEFPYEWIEIQDDGVIIDIPTSYIKSIQSIDINGNPVFVTRDILDNDGNIVDSENIPVMDLVEISIDVESIGVASSWEEVTDIMKFDLFIGGVLYSWQKKEGATHIGMDRDGYIGVVDYKPFFVNCNRLNTIRLISPKFDPLRIVNGRIEVNGRCSEDCVFIGINGKEYTLGDIRMVREGVNKQLNFPVVVEEMI